MKRTRLSGLALIAVGVLAIIGCSEPGEPGDVDVDSGFIDIGEKPTDGDAGGIFIPDGGTADSGVPPCPMGTEGCPCGFESENCAGDLVCVPWDTAAGIDRDDPNLVAPVQTCVQRCDVDADCGVGPNGMPRHCADTFLGPDIGVSRICVDAITDADSFCGFSRLAAPRLRSLNGLATPGRMVGCADTELCVPFEELHPDEGICLDICLNADDCGGDTPYCNPIFPTETPTISLGVCSTSRKGVGALCGTADPDQVGFTELCDMSSAAVPNTICLLGPDVGLALAPRLGICSTLCDEENPCTLVDSVLGPTSCSEPYLRFAPDQPLVGVCNTGCSAFPDTCGGSGALGAGRLCTELDDIVHMCVDVVPPTLATGALDDAGNPMLSVGDNCLADQGAASVSCPAGAACFLVEVAVPPEGRCFFGCRLGQDEVCDTLLGVPSSRCAAVLTSTVNGVCRTP